MTDFKEVAYFAVSLFVAAFIITLVAALSLIVGQTASARHAEIQAADMIRLSRSVAAYDNTLIMGADVIALLRENAIREEVLDIVLDRDAYGVSMTMNAGNATQSTWSLANLTQRINPDAVYRVILVYGGENPATAVYSSGNSYEVTGIRITSG